MSKKSRRERRPNLPPEAFNVPVRAPAPASPDAKAGPAKADAAAPSSMPAVANLRREYGEVLDDLRLTSLIFLAIVAVMVVLSFVVR
ncbi:MAG: hypothetical protein RML99_10745 [Anaerolineae bacterium]|nr:hypothetical protein [Anaerolineae bacterium]